MQFRYPCSEKVEGKRKMSSSQWHPWHNAGTRSTRRTVTGSVQPVSQHAAVVQVRTAHNNYLVVHDKHLTVYIHLQMKAKNFERISASQPKHTLSTIRFTPDSQSDSKNWNSPPPPDSHANIRRNNVLVCRKPVRRHLAWKSMDDQLRTLHRIL